MWHMFSVYCHSLFSVNFFVFTLKIIITQTEFYINPKLKILYGGFVYKTTYKRNVIKLGLMSLILYNMQLHFLNFCPILILKGSKSPERV